MRSFETEDEEDAELGAGGSPPSPEWSEACEQGRGGRGGCGGCGLVHCCQRPLMWVLWVLCMLIVAGALGFRAWKLKDVERQAAERLGEQKTKFCAVQDGGAVHEEEKGDAQPHPAVPAVVPEVVRAAAPVAVPEAVPEAGPAGVSEAVRAAAPAAGLGATVAETQEDGNQMEEKVDEMPMSDEEDLPSETPGTKAQEASQALVDSGSDNRVLEVGHGSLSGQASLPSFPPDDPQLSGVTGVSAAKTELDGVDGGRAATLGSSTDSSSLGSNSPVGEEGSNGSGRDIVAFPERTSEEATTDDLKSEGSQGEDGDSQGEEQEPKTQEQEPKTQDQRNCVV